ncbi:hypothetical protein SAMN06297280_1503 [Arsukibacterium tuosuense]|uniref:Uncharacterized protein n=1 Tax=Arsukibacterium tuosuense TaxID=1323745 RepID=A0A285IRH0_9GAMM|nr:hypothetical protein [Arsukibacterium tuosuense]SNY49686.1 hypothetical protein SAMN06297280_1503 [Arsukibacterium tuosuense]
MAELLSIANLLAVVGAVGTAWMGLRTYRQQKEIDLEYHKEEVEREAVTEYLASLDTLINHAAYCEEHGKHDQADKILMCKQKINKIYIYAPAEVVVAMDTLLTEASELASIISKIPNAEMFDVDKVALYANERDRTQNAYSVAVNVARQHIGLHKQSVGAVQLFLLGKK